MEKTDADLRSDTPKESCKCCTNILSAKRQFYRWFPSYHQVLFFESQGYGTSPRMKYREDLRAKDQELLAAKIIAKKNNGSKEEVYNAAQMLKD